MSGYRCCRHCADDPVHDVPVDGHADPCGGSYGPCSDGGDELAPIPADNDLVYDDGDDWCYYGYGCSSEGWACTCG